MVLEVPSLMTGAPDCRGAGGGVRSGVSFRPSVPIAFATFRFAIVCQPSFGSGQNCTSTPPAGAVPRGGANPSTSTAP